MTIERLLLTPTVRDALFAHAREDSASVEVCGVLGGKHRDMRRDANTGGTSDTALVTAHRRVPNVAAEPSLRYELDPAATVDAIEDLESNDLEHLGFYHSHPEGPRGPSRTDEARATWPGSVYLIVSLGAEPVIGAWRWTGESFVQLPVEIAKDSDD